jgi:hypothetical protein
MKNVRIEVKGKGGRLVPFAKEVPTNLTVYDAARWYLNEVSRADFVAIAFIKRGNSRMNMGNGSVSVALYSKERVLRAIDRMEAAQANTFGVLKVVGNQLKVMGTEAGRVMQTFGAPDQLYSTDLTKWDDIKPDPGCPNAPYARAWEKVVAKATAGKWVGALRGVQVDVIINPNDD